MGTGPGAERGIPGAKCCRCQIGDESEEKKRDRAARRAEHVLNPMRSHSLGKLIQFWPGNGGDSPWTTSLQSQVHLVVNSIWHLVCFPQHFQNYTIISLNDIIYYINYYIKNVWQS